MTSRAPVLQRKVALIHKGVPRAVTTPRAHKKLNTPAVQKMTFFCWFGMLKLAFVRARFKNKTFVSAEKRLPLRPHLLETLNRQISAKKATSPLMEMVRCQ